MNVVIYESSAYGGNYRYAIELFAAYRNHKKITKATLLIPRNSQAIDRASAILLQDRIEAPRIFQKSFFLWRSIVNPFILFFYLLRQKKSLVILNDFEQLTAILWVPLFKLFLSRHAFAVFLHDPDRDNYPPSKAYSEFSMKILMSAMRLALYHEHLPKKNYYENSSTRYVSVPHGIYVLPAADPDLKETLMKFRANSFVLAILGNLRQEKNYEMALRCLNASPDLKLLVAGSLANSSVPISEWKKLAKELNVESRVYWHLNYMSESEFVAAINVADCVLLNYASTFTSQSGILTMLAPFKKKIIVSETDSSLTAVVKRYHLGELIKAGSQDGLIQSVLKIKTKNRSADGGWDEFINYSSWDRQVEIVLNSCSDAG